ncbi:MAG: hypothetical protein IPK00_23745 [Deltaproteobacteria bacterium]|nr:hypothetical protein [Deltaproteobacteria bacterium]
MRLDVGPDRRRPRAAARRAGPNAGKLLSTDFYARQHLLHLPVDPQRRTAFIASNTSKYGGGTRRLGEILDVELGQRQKGYAFLAHPFSQGKGDGVGSLGPDLISYTRAQLDDAFASPYILGLQIWNENPVSSAEANDAEPFQSPHWESQEQPFLFADFQKWDLLQLRGLDKNRTASLSWLPSGTPRRIFAAGGSDAHGDFNYRRKGFFLGMNEATDTAIGKPRNLVHVGPAAGTPLASALGTAVPLSQSQVVDGLRSGNFAITDGPAVQIMVDANKNGTIDSGDVPMGGIHKHTLDGPFQVIVEWKSTPEFAPVQSINLLLGVWAEEVPEGMVYTVHDGGPHVDPDFNYRHPDGRTFTASVNIPYWFDPNPGNPFSIVPGPTEGYAGRRVVTIDPAKYPVGRRMCIQPNVGRTTTTATGSTTSTASLTASTTLASAKTGTTTGGTTTSTGGTAVPLQQSLDNQLQDLLNGVVDVFPPCTDRVFANPTRPDRVFVRAEVRNKIAPDSSALCSTIPSSALPPCVRRIAYTNPVWVKVEPCTNVLSCSANVAVTGTLTPSRTDGTTTSPTTGTTTGTTTGVGTTTSLGATKLATTPTR